MKIAEYSITFSLLKFLIFLLSYSVVSSIFSIGEMPNSYLSITIKRTIQFLLCLILIYSLYGNSMINLFNKIKEIKALDLILMVIITLIFIFIYEFTIQRVIDNNLLLGNNSNHVELSNYEMYGIVLQSLIIAPFLEEILIRDYLQTAMHQKYGLIIAILICNIIFTILHFDYINSIFYFLIGILFSLIMIKYDNIFYTIILHFIVNLVYIISSASNIT